MTSPVRHLRSSSPGGDRSGDGQVTVVAVRCMPSFLPLHSPFVTALRRTETVESLLVEVETSAGVIGVGESPQVWQVTGESVASAMACVDQMLAPVVVGRSIADWPSLSDEVQLLTVTSGPVNHFGSVTIEVQSTGKCYGPYAGFSILCRVA